MAVSPIATDRFTFGILYAMAAAILFWAGSPLIDQGLASRFFNDYLPQWEVSIRAHTAQQGQWPKFSGSNHKDYMDGLIRQMAIAGVPLPNSNTQVTYRYRIKKIGAGDEDIFILCFHDRLILYGLSNQSMNRLDKAIDRHPDLIHGQVSGHLGKNGKTYIGTWRI